MGSPDRPPDPAASTAPRPGHGPSQPPRRRLLWSVGALAAIAGASVGTLLLGRRRPEDGAEGGEAVQRSLLEQAFPDADGAARRLADWDGRLRVVNFWATWCPPCVEEMPDLQRVHDSYSARRVTVIGMGIDSAARIRAFRDQHAIGFPLLVAGMGGSDLGRALGNDAGALPYTVLLSPQGRVLHRHHGALVPAELRQWLDRRLGPA